MVDVDKSKSTRVRIAGGACGGFTLSSFSSLFLSLFARPGSMEIQGRWCAARIQ